MTKPPVLVDITVVVPTLGREVLDDCLTSIADGDAWPNRLLAVDQSPEGAAAAPVSRLKAMGLDAVHLPMRGRGVAAGTNYGLARVRTPMVAVTHDDCRVHHTWLPRAAERLRRSANPIVITGRVLPEDGADVPSVITSTEPVVYTRPLRSRDVLFPANMAFPLTVWEQVGPMDEDLLTRASEDNDWAYRVLRSGIPIAYAPELVVEHRAWRDVTARAHVEWDYARSQGAWYGKQLRGGDAHFLVRLGSDLAHGAWCRARGRLTRDAALLNLGRAGTTGLIAGLLTGLRHGRPTPAPAVRRG